VPNLIAPIADEHSLNVEIPTADMTNDGGCL